MRQNTNHTPIVELLVFKYHKTVCLDAMDEYLARIPSYLVAKKIELAKVVEGVRRTRELHTVQYRMNEP